MELDKKKKSGHPGIKKDLQNNDTYVPVLHQSLNWYNILRIKMTVMMGQLKSSRHSHAKRHTHTHMFLLKNNNRSLDFEAKILKLSTIMAPTVFRELIN